MRLLFTTIIFLFLLSAYAQKDSLVFIKAADLKSDSEILTSRDSIMLDSVYNLFKQLDVLENTINSLEDSLYSDYLVNLLCEKYAQKIEKDFEIRLDFIAKNIFKHNFIYGELDPITMERTKILNNPFFLEVLSLYMIENGFLLRPRK
jgi:hypothetical protein